MSMKQYSNYFSNFTVTKTVTENTKWDSKKEKHIKLAKPKVTKKVIFPSKNLYDFADLVRACDIITDSEGSLYEGANTEKVLKVEFELETSY